MSCLLNNIFGTVYDYTHVLGPRVSCRCYRKRISNYSWHAHRVLCFLLILLIHRYYRSVLRCFIQVFILRCKLKVVLPTCRQLIEISCNLEVSWMPLFISCVNLTATSTMSCAVLCTDIPLHLCYNIHEQNVNTIYFLVAPHPHYHFSTRLPFVICILEEHVLTPRDRNKEGEGEGQRC